MLYVIFGFKILEYFEIKKCCKMLMNAAFGVYNKFLLIKYGLKCASHIN